MAGEATSGQRVADMAEGVIHDAKHTTYQHTSYIDVATGTYDVDCNGFVGYVLETIAPEHFHEVPKEADQKRPRAFKYYEFFADPPDGGAPGWLPISRLADARRGDIIAWELEADPALDPHKNTGHVMIVADDPGDEGDNVLSVRVHDSSEDPHFDDSRQPPATGVGTGTVQIRVNLEGQPIAFRFGPPPDQFHTHPISIGRLVPLTP